MSTIRDELRDAFIEVGNELSVEMGAKIAYRNNENVTTSDIDAGIGPIDEDLKVILRCRAYEEARPFWVSPQLNFATEPRPEEVVIFETRNWIVKRVQADSVKARWKLDCVSTHVKGVGV